MCHKISVIFILGGCWLSWEQEVGLKRKVAIYSIKGTEVVRPKYNFIKLISTYIK